MAKNDTLATIVTALVPLAIFLVFWKDLKGLLGGKSEKTEVELQVENSIVGVADDVLITDLTVDNFEQYKSWATQLYDSWNGWSWAGNNSHEVALSILNPIYETLNYHDYIYLYSAFGYREKQDIIGWMLHESADLYAEHIEAFRDALEWNNQNLP